MKGDAALRAEVEAAVLAEIERIGPDGFAKDGVVKRFVGRGTGRSTIYRWVDVILASGKPGQHIAKAVERAAAARAATTPDPAVAAAGEVIERLPAVVRLDEMVRTEGTVPAIERLQKCIQIAEKVISHAETPEGAVRNARLLLQASEHLRRTIDSCVRLQEAVMEVSQVERFHQAIFDMLREESPTFAEKVLIQLRQLNVQWGVV